MPVVCVPATAGGPVRSRSRAPAGRAAAATALRRPVASSRASDQRVAWIPSQASGSGGNGSGRLAHHLQPGALGRTRRRAGRASRRRRSGRRRRPRPVKPAAYAVRPAVGGAVERAEPGRGVDDARPAVREADARAAAGTSSAKCRGEHLERLGPVRRARPRSSARSGRSRRTRPTGSGGPASAGSSGTGCPSRRSRRPGPSRRAPAGRRSAARWPARSRRPGRPTSAVRRSRSGKTLVASTTRARGSTAPPVVTCTTAGPRRRTDGHPGVLVHAYAEPLGRVRRAPRPAGPGRPRRVTSGLVAGRRGRSASRRARARPSASRKPGTVRLQVGDLVRAGGDREHAAAREAAVDAVARDRLLDVVEVAQAELVQRVVLVGPAGAAVGLAVGQAAPRRSRRCGRWRARRCGRPRRSSDPSGRGRARRPAAPSRAR